MSTTKNEHREESVNGHAAAVTANNLVRHFRTRSEVIRAVDDVSLEIRRGEVAVLAGRSGSGKTTLLNLLLGWDEPDGGTVSTAVGDDLGWSGIAVIPQGLGLLPELTARQNIEIAATLAGPDSDRDDGISVDDLVGQLELVGLQRRRPSQLSLGEQQRVAIARALVCRPAVLVADEPTAHQEERRARQVVELFRVLAQRGSAVLVASHDEVVLDEGDCRFDLDDGRLVEQAY